MRLPLVAPMPRRDRAVRRLAAAAAVVVLAMVPGVARGGGESAAPAPPRPTYEVHPTAASITVDGRLEEAPWQGEPTISLDYETRPGENVPPAVRTLGWITHDEEHLYVAFMAYDPEPAKVRSRLTDRDRAFRDDFVGVVLDTFNDERRAFEFFVNPAGVQMDLVQNEVTGNEDDSWDTIWLSAGRLHSEGYTVEMAIPFSSLRFPRAEGRQTWGLDAVRIWPRDKRRRIGLNPLPRNSNCYLCQASKLVGFEGVTPGRNLEIAPTLTATRTDERRDFPRGPLASGEEDADPGLTVRWGMTPNLTLNGTLNPDFSQVEADVAQLEVNTQFALFFPEKRPFFLEGGDLFDTRINAVYTRNIADPDWGVKLTGKEGKHALGLILAADRVTNLLIPASQGSALTSLDEGNTSAVLRYRRDLLGASTAGVLFTSRQGGDYTNQVAGLDTLFRWAGSNSARLELLGSATEYPGSLVVDFGQRAGRLEDFALRAAYQHQTEQWFGYLLYQDVGEDFRADLGFIPQVDLRRGEASAERYWYRDEGWTRFSLGFWTREDRDHAGQRLARTGELYAWADGPRQAFYRVTVGAGDRFFAGTLFDNRYVSFYGEAQPIGSVFVGLEGRIGDDVDLANARAAHSVLLIPSLRFDLGRHLLLQLDHTFQRLETGGARLFTANLAQLRATYQINVRTFVRWVAQHLDVDREPGLDAERVAPSTERLFNQLLFSYKINPQTVFFVGYSDNYRAAAAMDLTQADRTLFLKVGYALVL